MSAIGNPDLFPSIGYPWTAAALVVARVAGVVAVAPGWSVAGLGVRFRIVLAMVLSLVVLPVVEPTLPRPADLAELGRWCFSEAAIGLVLGLFAALIVSGARQAGEIVGFQAGFAASAIDLEEADGPPTSLGHLFGLVALAIFLALDGPFALLRGVIESYQAIPTGGPSMSSETVAAAFGRVGQSLALTLRAALPATLALFVAQVALALLARVAPTLGLSTLAPAARLALGVFFVLVGLATLALTLASTWRLMLAG